MGPEFWRCAAVFQVGASTGFLLFIVLATFIGGQVWWAWTLDYLGVVWTSWYGRYCWRYAAEFER